MNKEFLKLDNESYVVSNETGELNIIKTKEDILTYDFESVLELENYIEELYNKLKKCC